MTEVTNVVIGGQMLDLGAPMSIEDARQMLEESGVATNIASAKANLLNDTTVEFINEYGENGHK